MPVPATSPSSTTASICRLLGGTRASACLVAHAFAARVPVGHGRRSSWPAPYRAFALALQHFYPDAMTSKAAMAGHGEPPVHPTPGWRRT